MAYLRFSVVMLIAISAVKSDVKDLEQGDLKEQIEMTFETSKNCDDFRNGKIRLEDLSIEQTGRNKMFLSGTLDMKVDLTKEFKLKVTLTKCPSKTERGMCEEFPPEFINDFCEKLPKKDQMWSDFVKHLKHFEPHCTVPKGHYKFVRHPLDMSGMSNMPVMVGYWIIKCEGFYGKEKVLCEQTEVSFARKKRRQHG